jgi:hypothetical protein
MRPFSVSMAVFLAQLVFHHPSLAEPSSGVTWEHLKATLSFDMGGDRPVFMAAMEQLEKAQQVHLERMEVRQKLKDSEGNDEQRDRLKAEFARLTGLEFALVFEGKKTAADRLEQATKSGETPNKKDRQLASLAGAPDRSALEMLRDSRIFGETEPGVDHEGMELLTDNFERYFGGKWNVVDSVGAARFQAGTKLEGQTYSARLLISQLKLDQGKIKPVGRLGEKIAGLMALAQVAESAQAMVPHFLSSFQQHTQKPERPVRVRGVSTTRSSHE